jgi:hypothetical protein
LGEYHARSPKKHDVLDYQQKAVDADLNCNSNDTDRLLRLVRESQ